MVHSPLERMLKSEGCLQAAGETQVNAYEIQFQCHRMQPGRMKKTSQEIGRAPTEPAAEEIKKSGTPYTPYVIMYLGLKYKSFDSLLHRMST